MAIGHEIHLTLRMKCYPGMEQRADTLKTFGLWFVFLLMDFSRTQPPGLPCARTGNFKLWMAALHRPALIFCITGKDRSQSLAAHHLIDLAAMPRSDLEVLPEFFSVSVLGAPFPRAGLDEQQMSNRWVKTVK